MKRATGNGGIFFKSDDPKNLYAWYEKHLGIEASADGTGPLSHGVMRKGRRLKGKSNPSPLSHAANYANLRRNAHTILASPDCDGCSVPLSRSGAC
jgi:hypothetical protein